MITYQDLRMNEKIPRQEVLDAVRDLGWQTFRKGLKGLDTQSKLDALLRYIVSHNGERVARIRVHNYIGALLRGGLLKKVDNT